MSGRKRKAVHVKRTLGKIYNLRIQNVRRGCLNVRLSVLKETPKV